MIRIRNLSKRYHSRSVLNDASLDLKAGEILVLAGPSGSGKTTLLRMIAGFEKPEEGSIEIDGVLVSTHARCLPPNERNLSMVFQDLALWPHMTVKQHIEYSLDGQKCRGEFSRLNGQEILDIVGLAQMEKRYPHNLSGGEKQRLALARALTIPSRYLLLDEPFSNLDVELKYELHKTIVRLKRELEIGVLYVTHGFDEVLAIADRIVFLHRGGIIEVGIEEADRRKQRNGYDALKGIVEKWRSQMGMS